MFWDQSSADQWQAARNAAVTLGLGLSGIELRQPPYDYERALDEAPSDYRSMLVVATTLVKYPPVSARYYILKSGGRFA
jgi:hypothetical protein